MTSVQKRTAETLGAQRFPSAVKCFLQWTQPFYDAVVRYAYTVQGQEYEGAQDDLTYVSNAQDAAQAIMARYQVGASVPVYYDPQAPQRALIDRSIRPHHLVGLLLASLLFPLLTAGGLLAILTGLAILAAPGPPPPD